MNHLREQWRERIAGPGGGVIPDRVKFRGPINIRQPRRVVVDPMAKKDYDRLEPHEKSGVLRAIRALENGKVQPEPKERELAGTYGLRIDADCRMLFYPHIDGAWHVYYVGDHDYQEAQRRMSAPRAAVKTARLQSGLLWRVHPTNRPFTVEDATSTPFSNPAARQVGYSCFDDPWHLWTYMWVQEIMFSPRDKDVIGFVGRVVGEGNDSELLAIPEREEVRLPWARFANELVSTPFPPSPLFGKSATMWSQLRRTWPALATHIRYLDNWRGDKVLAHILDIWDS